MYLDLNDEMSNLIQHWEEEYSKHRSARTNYDDGLCLAYGEALDMVIDPNQSEADIESQLDDIIQLVETKNTSNPQGDLNRGFFVGLRLIAEDAKKLQNQF